MGGPLWARAPTAGNQSRQAPSWCAIPPGGPPWPRRQVGVRGCHPGAPRIRRQFRLSIPNLFRASPRRWQGKSLGSWSSFLETTTARGYRTPLPAREVSPGSQGAARAVRALPGRRVRLVQAPPRSWPGLRAPAARAEGGRDQGRATAAQGLRSSRAEGPVRPTASRSA